MNSDILDKAIQLLSCNNNISSLTIKINDEDVLVKKIPQANKTVYNDSYIVVNSHNFDTNKWERSPNPRILFPKNSENTTVKYKTKLCKNYIDSELSGQTLCPYGDKCIYAHGVNELRCKYADCSYKGCNRLH